MIKKNISIEMIGTKHFLLQNLTNSPMFFRADNFHPFFEAFPLSKHNKEIVSTNLIKSLDLLKPLLHWNKLCRFWIYKSAHSFATKCVVILYFFAYYLWIRDHLHVVVIILLLILLNHVDKFISCQLFLTHHLEKCCYFAICYLDVLTLIFLHWNWWR